MNLAVVPARSGSKGLLDKNIRTVGGVPLLENAIRTAQKTTRIDRVIVSTDSERYAGMARDAGAKVPGLRPDRLANDDSSIAEVLNHLLKEILPGPNRVDTITLLEPTSPFRRYRHIAECFNTLEQNDLRSVITVQPLTKKPEYIFEKKHNRLQPYVQQPREHFEQRQQMNHLCRLNSAVYLVETKAFLRTGSLIVDPVGYVEMSEWESVNIDTPLELKLANLIAEEQ